MGNFAHHSFLNVEFKTKATSTPVFASRFWMIGSAIPLYLPPSLECL
jgi:hypothetical protein